MKVFQYVTLSSRSFVLLCATSSSSISQSSSAGEKCSKIIFFKKFGDVINNTWFIKGLVCVLRI